jgi:hypothetical protein
VISAFLHEHATIAHRAREEFRFGEVSRVVGAQARDPAGTGIDDGRGVAKSVRAVDADDLERPPTPAIVKTALEHQVNVAGVS